MAGGRFVRRFEQVLGIIGVIALIITYSLITGWNPLENLPSKIKMPEFGGLSKPAASWQEKTGDQPTAAVAAGDVVVVTMRDAVQAHDLDSGALQWKRDADWVAVAGDETAAVVVVGRRNAGLEVVDPSSGSTRWKDETAVGAWTYRDAVLTLSCGDATQCTLAARTPSDGNARWRTGLPGAGRVHAGVNRELMGSRRVSDTYGDAVAAQPEAMPAMLGFPIDNRVQYVDTASGRLAGVESPSNSVRAVALGGRAVISTVVKRGDNCRYTLEAREAGAGRSVWKKEGYDLDTVSGAGCEQRKDPSGTNGVIVGIRDSDRRAVFLNARDGREIWAAGEGQTIAATDGRVGLVRSADGGRLTAVDLGSGTAGWQVDTVPKSDVAMTRWAALVSDPATSRIRAYDPSGGKLIVDVRTTGEVLGTAPTGVIIGRGRTIGFVPYGTLFID